MPMSKLPADIELEIIQYLEPSDISNYYTSLDKPMPSKIIPFFAEKWKKEGQLNFRKELGHGQMFCICDCYRLKLGQKVGEGWASTECAVGFCRNCHRMGCCDCGIDLWEHICKECKEKGITIDAWGHPSPSTLPKCNNNKGMVPEGSWDFPEE